MACKNHPPPSSPSCPLSHTVLLFCFTSPNSACMAPEKLIRIRKMFTQAPEPKLYSLHSNFPGHLPCCNTRFQTRRWIFCHSQKLIWIAKFFRGITDTKWPFNDANGYSLTLPCYPAPLQNSQNSKVYLLFTRIRHKFQLGPIKTE